ncbi:hypothetical protein HY214_02715 [Candidatus Roizmanbacteria bacterium]|nr:hypothetical protein [Candidatus Roizmanbacteria bacterium]
MRKKTAFYALTFTILFFLNFLVVIKLYLHTSRKVYANQILGEIEKSAKNSQFNFSTAPFVASAYQADAELGDSRVANLKNFFRRNNSVLYAEAELFVKYADIYHFDYRLLPAIAMQESNLCKFIPDDSHNCWGWGIYGNTVTKFDSYAEAIAAVSRGIKYNYIDKGLVTASAIMEKYNPSSNGSWAHGVNFFLRVLE